MSYSLFYTDVPMPSGQTPDFRRLIPINFDTKDAAIIAACKSIKAGAVVWQIAGPDGFAIDRAIIESECRARHCG
jgi:hypothetical protein